MAATREAEISVCTRLKVYGDTNTLPENASRVQPAEYAALKHLWNNPQLDWYKSHIVRHEAENTRDTVRRAKLVGESDVRHRVPNDEKVVGFNTQSDRHRSFIGHFLLADVQDQALFDELTNRGLTLRDAQHIAQAVSNECDVFLTCDERTIIRPHRVWLSQRFPTLMVLCPSEFILWLDHSALSCTG